MPAIAGPPAAPTVNATLSSALPSRSCPAGARIAVAAVLVSARAAEAIEPSNVASARTAMSAKSSAISARTANATASAAYRPGRLKRTGADSSRATSGGPSTAGAKCMPQNSAAVAIGLPVWSNTRIASAISPSQFPNSLTR